MDRTIATKYEHLKVCQLTVESAKENLDDEGGTEYHDAAESGHYSICHFFVSSNGGNNPKNDVGQTPLHLAAKFGHFEIF